jgi:hypothetical protein
MSTSEQQLVAALILIVGGIVFVLVVHDLAERSSYRARARRLSPLARRRLNMRLAREVDEIDGEINDALGGVR